MVSCVACGISHFTSDRSAIQMQATKSLTNQNEFSAAQENMRVKPRRSLRKIIRPVIKNVEKSTILPKPTQLKFGTNNLQEITNYYLNSIVKLKKSSTLETIYEDPKEVVGSVVNFMSNRKFKRVICFNDKTKQKIVSKTKRRLHRIKKLGMKRSKKISKEIFEKKIKSLHEDDEL